MCRSTKSLGLKYGFDTRTLLLASLIMLAGFACLAGQTVYVVPADTSGHGPSAPYTSWETAATNIQTAIDEAVSSNWPNVMVSNGWYTLDAGIAINNPVYVRSWNAGDIDPDGTIIDGASLTAVSINNLEAVFEGFMVTNAAIPILIDSGLARNCVAAYNSSHLLVQSGGILEDSVVRDNHDNQARGVYINGGIVRGCEIYGHLVVDEHGAGVFIANGGELFDSVVSNNQQTGSSSSYFGGGMFISSEGFVSNSLIINNNARNRGGGVYFSAGGNDTIVLENCQIIGNQVTENNNGGGAYVNGGTLRNSLVAYNSAYRGGGLYLLAGSVMENCTIVSNSASYQGGGIHTPSSGAGSIVNSILYYNDCGSGANIYGYTQLSWTNNCVPDVPLNDYGTNNITDAPEFVGLDSGDFRLKHNSPCINVGKKLGWHDNTVDLDGRRRIDRYSGIVDIGCYEYIPRGVMFYVR